MAGNTLKQILVLWNKLEPKKEHNIEHQLPVKHRLEATILSIIEENITNLEAKAKRVDFPCSEQHHILQLNFLHTRYCRQISICILKKVEY